jgi:carbon-monoxide dehydrogenase small subunit
MVISIKINGHLHTIDTQPQRLLADVIREEVGLTGTKTGCDSGQCGVCTVLLDGRSVKSCMVLAAQADGRDVTTIEGLSEPGQLHPLQEAFWEQHGLQCGFCTPGMLLLLADCLATNPNPTEHDIRRWLDGVLCRCTGYQNVVSAVQAAIQKMANATQSG